MNYVCQRQKSATLLIQNYYHINMAMSYVTLAKSLFNSGVIFFPMHNTVYSLSA